MTHRGPFQPLLFCDSVILGHIPSGHTPSGCTPSGHIPSGCIPSGSPAVVLLTAACTGCTAKARTRRRWRKRSKCWFSAGAEELPSPWGSVEHAAVPVPPLLLQTVGPPAFTCTHACSSGALRCQALNVLFSPIHIKRFKQVSGA